MKDSLDSGGNSKDADYGACRDERQLTLDFQRLAR